MGGSSPNRSPAGAPSAIAPSVGHEKSNNNPAFVAAFCITMILYTDSSRFDDVFFEGTIFLFLIGIYAAFRAPSLKTKNALFVVGINIFTLLLAWMPCLPLLFSDETFGLDRLYFKLFSLGVVILFAVAPWAQRRYLALQAKPS